MPRITHNHFPPRNRPPPFFRLSLNFFFLGGFSYPAAVWNVKYDGRATQGRDVIEFRSKGTITELNDRNETNLSEQVVVISTRMH